MIRMKGPHPRIVKMEETENIMDLLRYPRSNSDGAERRKGGAD
jgi:hypothetical protein